jgi:radical SAM protein with 4Fe4S-binding SPASM domain
MKRITERIDGVTLVTQDRYTAAPPAPKSVKIELTGRCNYRCGFCALRTRKEQPKGDMDWGLFKRITTEMREAGVEEIGAFYLGESFMAPELLTNAIRWCKKDLQFPYVFLTTNGSLCTPNALRGVMEAGLDSLKFSINAADLTQFKQVMGVKGSLYGEALRAVARARKIRDSGGYDCGIYASSIQYDGVQQEKMERLLDEYVRPHVDEHYWLPLYSMGSLATEREAQLGFRPTAGNQGRLGALREPLPCWSAFTEGHVTADGYLSACCFDADSRWKMGDLNKQSFMEAWHSPEFIKLRHAHLKKDVTGTPCEECVAYQ